MTTLAFGAHPDDCILGCGGTILNLAKSERVVVAIFTRGQSYPFWKKTRKVSRKRALELEEASSKLGIDKTVFLGSKDLGIDKRIRKKVLQLLEEEAPDKVFYHSSKDPHPDHRVVNKIIEEALEDYGFKGKRYCYEVSTWLPSGEPVSIMDISNTFGSKIKALTQFRSQKLLLVPLILLTSIKSLYLGLTNGFTYAEKFYSK